MVRITSTSVPSNSILLFKSLSFAVSSHWSLTRADNDSVRRITSAMKWFTCQGLASCTLFRCQKRWSKKRAPRWKGLAGKTVVYLLGDSNFFFEGTRSGFRRHFPQLWKFPSLAEELRAKLKEDSNDRCQVICIPCHRLCDWGYQYEYSLGDSLRVLLETRNVHVLVWMGQNDADARSRSSTRIQDMEAAGNSFQEWSFRRIRHITQFFHALHVPVSWILPVDDEACQFTPEYCRYVHILQAVIQSQGFLVDLRWRDIPEVNRQFETDRYHFRSVTRSILAHRIVDCLKQECG